MIGKQKMCKEKLARNRGFCKNNPVKDGYCTFHYNRLPKEPAKESPAIGEISPIKRETCKQELVNKKGLCQRPTSVDGYCMYHYKRLFDGNEEDDEERCKVITATGDVCDKKIFTDGMCKIHKTWTDKNKGIVHQLIEHNGETMPCSHIEHKPGNSKYPKERVPIEKFKKDNGGFYKTCIDCRNIANARNKGKRDLFHEINEKSQREGSETIVCCSDCHDVEGVSMYPRDKVPIELFDLTKESYRCNDCKNYCAKNQGKFVDAKREKCQKEGKHLCERCHKIVNQNERTINIDGKLGTMCIPCGEYVTKNNKENYAYLKNLFRKIQREMIIKSGYSCQNCKSIILQPEEGSYIPVVLSTYSKNGSECVNYKGESYETKTFLEKFVDLLECRIIEFDHLTEEEQRTRGILSPDAPYIGKIECVSKMKDEASMREEVKKCQNLCCKCHIAITISREHGKSNRSKSEQEKYDYVNGLKKSGCEICKFYDDKLLRYLDMDHKIPREKNVTVSQMMKKGKYSLEDVIKESSLCRVLCKSCHKILTDEQTKLGLIPHYTNETFQMGIISNRIVDQAYSKTPPKLVIVK